MRSQAGTNTDDAASASGASTVTNDEDEAVQLLGQPGAQEVDSDFERELALLVGGPSGQPTAGGLPIPPQAPSSYQHEYPPRADSSATVDFKVMLRKGAKPRSVQVGASGEWALQHVCFRFQLR